MDLFSDKSITGKEIFSDIRAGIYTYPVIRALEDEKYGKDIYGILAKNRKEGLSQEELQYIRKLLIGAQAHTLSNEKIKDLADENRNILASLNRNDLYHLEKILEKVEKS